MTCARCGKSIVQPKVGRRRRFCPGGACRQAAYRTRRASTLSVAELGARIGVSEAEANLLVAGLKPGYIDRCGDRLKIAAAADADALRAIFSLIEAGNVALEPGDEGEPVRIRPGPARGTRRRQAIAA